MTITVASSHTYDPNDLQIALVERYWSSTSPTIALYEGGVIPVPADANEAVTRFGEPGFVRFLAARDDLPCESLGPSREEEIAHLVREFDAEIVVHFYLLRDFPSARHGRTDAEAAEAILGDLARFDGLDGGPRSIAEIDEAMVRRFPDVGDWRDAPPSLLDPAPWPGLVVRESNLVTRELARFRDERMVERLIQLVDAGETVLAVVGASHVVMQEPALPAATESPNLAKLSATAPSAMMDTDPRTP